MRCDRLLCNLLTVGFSVVCMAAAGRTDPPAEADLAPAEKIYGLSLFWKEAADHFAFFDHVPNLDWDKAYREAIPRVLATKSTREYYRELMRFCALLKDGHTNVDQPSDLGNIFYPAGTKLAYPHFALATIGKRLYIFGIPKSRANEIPLGSEIVAVDGGPIEKHLGQFLPYISSSTDEHRWAAAVNRMILGPKGSRFAITIRTPEGQTRDVALERGGGKRGEEFVIKRKPLQLAPSLVQYKDLGDGIAYVALNSFANMKTAEQFEALLPKLEGAKGLVIDLRANNGGSDLVALRILVQFTRGKFRGFAWRTREVKSAFRAWGQQVKPNARDLTAFDRTVLNHYRGTAWHREEAATYQGRADAQLLMPKVVLTGPATASAAEDTVLFMDTIPNITTVGERTFGSTGQPYVFALPGGGTGRVCTHRVTFPDGREFVGTGIAPKVEVKPTIDDYVNGRDPVLERGIEVLGKMIAEQK